MHDLVVSDGAWLRDRWLRHLRQVVTFLDRKQQEQLAAGTRFALPRLLTHPRASNEALIRALCRSVYLGDDTLLCRVLGRYKVYVDSKDKGLSSHLLMDGFWEMWITETMTRLIEPGMVVADIGANLGYYTVLMGELVGADGWVHAFEPNPPIAELLRGTVAMNAGSRRTTIHEIALTDVDGSVTLYAPPSEPKNATIIAAPDGPDRVSVAARRLDSLAGMERLDFIKIDAEGAEEAIWGGMRGLLDRAEPLTIMLEFGAARLGDPGRFIDEIVANGFRLRRILLSGRTVPTSREELLALPGDEDQMLLLQR